MRGSFRHGCTQVGRTCDVSLSKLFNDLQQCTLKCDVSFLFGSSDEGRARLQEALEFISQVEADTRTRYQRIPDYTSGEASAAAVDVEWRGGLLGHPTLGISSYYVQMAGKEANRLPIDSPVIGPRAPVTTF